LQHDRASWLQATHQLGDDLDFRILGDSRQIIGQKTVREWTIARFAEVSNNCVSQDEIFSRMAGNTFVMLNQDLGHPRSYRTQTHNGDTC
jgi:hypothetical protein